MDHITTTNFAKTKAAKVDLTAGMQRILLYQNIWQFIQLPPIWLGETIELTSIHQALNPL